MTSQFADSHSVSSTVWFKGSSVCLVCNNDTPFKHIHTYTSRLLFGTTVEQSKPLKYKQPRVHCKHWPTCLHHNWFVITLLWASSALLLSLLTWWYQLGIPARSRKNPQQQLPREAYYLYQQIKCKIIYPMHTIHPFQIKMLIFKVFWVCHFSLAIIFLQVELFLIHQLGHVT